MIIIIETVFVCCAGPVDMSDAVTGMIWHGYDYSYFNYTVLTLHCVDFAACSAHRH